MALQHHCYGSGSASLGVDPSRKRGETLFAIGPGDNTLYEGWKGNGTWTFTPIYSQDGAQAVTVSATYLSAPPPYSFAYIYYVAHTDWDGKIRLTSSSWLSGWTTTPPIDTVTKSNLATVMYVSG